MTENQVNVIRFAALSLELTLCDSLKNDFEEDRIQKENVLQGLFCNADLLGLDSGEIIKEFERQMSVVSWLRPSMMESPWGF